MTEDMPSNASPDLPEGGPERRALLTQDVTDRTGIDEAMIYRLVHSFYGRVRQDLLIGPIFAAKITDWAPHLSTMCDFWSSVVLMTGRYHGRPLARHFPLPIDSEHFDRWLELFTQTAREVCPPVAAAVFLDRAYRIADSFDLALQAQRGELRPYKRRQVPADV